jgi:hypothetical protein
LRLAAIVAVACLAVPGSLAQGQTCSPLPAPTGTVVDVTPAQAPQLSQIVASTPSGATIRLADGFYPLGGASLWFRNADVTLRSASGNASAVVLDNGHAGGSILEIAASNVTIAELTVQRSYDHPIHVAPSAVPVSGTLIHGVRVIDPGQQGIKVNANGALNADDGEIRCSLVRLTDEGRPFVRDDCYTGGIDGHRARGWRVRDNVVEGFWCPSGLSEHAIHFWTGSRDTLVERNVLRNNARGIGFGLGQGTAGRTYADAPCPGVTSAGHFRGTIRNNTVLANDTRLFASQAGFDAGIALEEACGVELLHNSVFSTQAPFSSIEWRFPLTSGRAANNLVSHNLRARDGAVLTSAGNLAGAPTSAVVSLTGDGDLHLSEAGAALARDRGVPLPAGLADADLDGETRDATPDVGADEWVAPAAPPWHRWFAVDTLETPYVGDFDGDGRSDIITFTRQNPNAVGDVYVALSNGSRFVDRNGTADSSDKWHDWFAISTDEQVVIGDFDGDGKDDIATWLARTTRQAYVALSIGTGMTKETVWTESIGFDPSDVLLAGDANGDGRDDLICFARRLGRVYVALSTGTSFAAPALWHSWFAVSVFERPRVADVNGDGRADIVTFATDNPAARGDVYVALSDGARFGDNAKWHDWFAVQPSEQVRIGDRDGDGRDDFFTFLPPPFAQCYAVRSLGAGMGANELWPEAVAPLATDVPFVGDANGDRKADLIVFSQSRGLVSVSLGR